MAELLIVIGIVGALAAVSFVGVISYLRTATKLEYDNYAKEIFIAAQNHLTMAKSQGYLGKTYFGTSEAATKDADTDTTISWPADTGGDVYYYVVTSGTREGEYRSTSVLNLILPFGSVDETIRAGGSYIIRYHKGKGQILDVFYWSETGRYAYTYSPGDYKTLLSLRGDEHKEELKKFGNAVIGYFGGEDVKSIETGKDLKKPKIAVKNAERLTVTVENTNVGTGMEKAELKLLITGATSKAQKELKLYTMGTSNLVPNEDKVSYITYDSTKNLFTIILDDITADQGHFYNKFCTTPGSNGNYFIPGENVVLQAVAYNNSQLTNVEYSSKRTTNSLFASVKTTSGRETTANISNIRHLENLEPAVSNLVLGSGTPADVSTALATIRPIIKSANQITDLSWPKFCTAICTAINSTPDTVKIYSWNNSTALTDVSKYYPVTPSELRSYNGRNHSIFGVDVSGSYQYGAGLFGRLTGNGSEFQANNLKLIDFKINNTGGPAGTLAGIADITVVENVSAFDTTPGGTEAAITGTGDTGGLIGQVSGTNSLNLKKSSASLVVASSAGNAGGLLGTANNNTEITACYSGGHVKDGDYSKVKDGSGNIVYNVTASAATGVAAGGLVGAANSATIKYSYSTCSVCGPTAGGFAGTAAGTIQNCYATGLVDDKNVPTATNTNDATEGSFIGVYSGILVDGSGTSTTCTGNKYLEIVNERLAADGKQLVYLHPIGTVAQVGDPAADVKVTVAKIDDTATTYNTFVGPEAATDGVAYSGWQKAVPYDKLLATYYRGMFDFKTVAQLVKDAHDTSVTFNTSDFVTTHYGDWPAPEVFVVNTTTP